jgi:hypothetical protein
VWIGRDWSQPLQHIAPAPPPTAPFFPLFSALQAVEMFIDEKLGYLDIMRVVEECCEAHRAEFVQAPSLEEIVHYDQWARRHVAERVNRGLAVAA